MEVVTHKCPNCGGALTFDPSDQKFHCPYCLSIFTADEVAKAEQAQQEAHVDPLITETNLGEEEQATMDLFTCPSCGAEIVTDATTAATYCYFCHNPVVLTGRLSGKFLPSRVLPFAIDQAEAKEKFLSWAKKKWFVPKDFFDEAQVEKLTGVYFPYWSIDAKTRGELSGVGTSVRVWIVGDLEYTETKRYAVRRKGTMAFKEYIQHALSKNVQQKMVTGVQPFPLEKAVPFQNQYLSGFQVEKRDLEFIDIKPEVDEALTQASQQLLRNTVNGYTTFRTNQTNAQILEEQNEYVLLPVWLVTYQGRTQDTPFYYAMNGQTGKTSGILPLSYLKLGLVSGSIFVVLAILLMIGGYFI